MDAAALEARIKAAGITRLWRLGQVPASPTYPYAVLSTTAEVPVVRDLGGSGDLGDRVTLQFFSRTEDGLHALATVAFNLLDGKPLPEADGEPVGEMQVSSGTYDDPDDNGVLSRTDTYLYY